LSYDYAYISNLEKELFRIQKGLSDLVARTSKSKDFEGVQSRVQTFLLPCGIMPSAISHGE